MPVATVTLRRVPPDAASISPLLAIMEECGARMAAELGLWHWVPPITLPELLAAAAERDVWALVSPASPAAAAGGEVVGAVITGPSSPAPYVSSSMFADPAAPALYISKLAVRPALQGGGLGRAALAALEALARERGLASLRLDALRAVPNLPRLYARAGFAVVATARASDAHGDVHELDIWERVLSL